MMFSHLYKSLFSCFLTCLVVWLGVRHCKFYLDRCWIFFVCVYLFWNLFVDVTPPPQPRFTLFLALLCFFFAVCGLSLTGESRAYSLVVSSVWASHCCGSRLQANWLSSCGQGAQLLRTMWDLPESGIEPLSPAFAGGFLTTEPPRKALWM